MVFLPFLMLALQRASAILNAMKIVEVPLMCEIGLRALIKITQNLFHLSPFASYTDYLIYSSRNKRRVRRADGDRLRQWP